MMAAAAVGCKVAMNIHTAHPVNVRCGIRPPVERRCLLFASGWGAGNRVSAWQRCGNCVASVDLSNADCKD